MSAMASPDGLQLLPSRIDVMTAGQRRFAARAQIVDQLRRRPPASGTRATRR